MGLKNHTVSSVFGIALLIGACPKRQTTSRLVYVPTPPPNAEPTPVRPTDTLVIEEPAPPPKPQEEIAPEPPPPKPAHRPRPVSPTERTDTSDVIAQPEEPPPTVEVPALEPRESREQESKLRADIMRLQNDVQQRVAQLEQTKLAEADQKTLEDARTFLAQARKAFEESDLQRSLTLARKADLLVAALQKGR